MYAELDAGGLLPRCLLFVDITINCESCIVAGPYCSLGFVYMVMAKEQM